MDFPEEKRCWICENDIFQHKRRASGKKAFKDKGQKNTFLFRYQKGDYVVHENHGIGKFTGIEQLKVQGEKKDYIKIKYAGNDIYTFPWNRWIWSRSMSGETALRRRSTSFPAESGKIPKPKQRPRWPFWPKI
ncbi:MAG: CarD family transcriptional regulator [Anaerovoracaceae bacterium]